MSETNKYPQIGYTFYNWTVIGEIVRVSSEKSRNRIMIPCQCVCGVIRNVAFSSIKKGCSKSCGCAPNNKSKNLLTFKSNECFVVDGIIFKVHPSELFAVSECGRVYGKSARVLKPKSQGHYLIVSYQVIVDGCVKKIRNKYVHRLVAETWLDNSFEKEHVNHIDGDKLNNNVRNLEWSTCAENHKHAIDSGLLWNLPSKGEQGFRSKND